MVNLLEQASRILADAHQLKSILERDVEKLSTHEVMIVRMLMQSIRENLDQIEYHLSLVWR